jgi:micrococcal nuclease
MKTTLLTCALFLAYCQAHAGDIPFTQQTRVTLSSVYDADTITVREWPVRLRLASIDAPERGQRGRAGQPYSRQAANALLDQLNRGTLSVQCYELDRSDRPICTIYLTALGQTTNVNQWLVQSGHAWAYTQHKRYLRDKSMLALQTEAQKDKRGLWRGTKAIPPWVWRKTCWQDKQCEGAEKP